MKSGIKFARLKFDGNNSATKAQRRDMNYKTLPRREESIAEKLYMQRIPFKKRY